MSELDGKPLRYLIGGDDTYAGSGDEVIELSYDAERPTSTGISIKYGNLFNEKYDEQSASEREQYAPYLEQGDTAAEYNEGQIDPDGQGWFKNLDEQFERALEQGFKIIELDNPDSYQMDDVLGAIERAHEHGLQTVAKNPLICQGDRVGYIRHPAVVGVVIEANCGGATTMEQLRRMAGKPTLPVWFVAFGAQQAWAAEVAQQIEAGRYVNMGVTYSAQGEYESSTDVLLPRPPTTPAPVPEATVEISIEVLGNAKVIVTGP